MHKKLAIFFLVNAFVLIGCAKGTPPIDTSGLTEASMNFDQEHVAPVLGQVAKLFPTGFGSDDVVRLTTAIDGLPVDKRANWEFSVVYKGKKERLVVAAFKDDFDAPDLYFYSSPTIAAEINLELTLFANKHAL